MRHLKDHRKLSRTSAHRKALMGNLVVSLIENERIKTTLPKAKELRRVADRVITWGKKGTIAARRQARVLINNRQALAKVFGELAPRYADRKGGYTRVLKLENRRGDQAPMALIEYLPAVTSASAEKPTKKKSAKKKAASKKVVEKKAAPSAEEKPKAKKATAATTKKPAAKKKSASKKKATKKAAKKS